MLIGVVWCRVVIDVSFRFVKVDALNEIENLYRAPASVGSGYHCVQGSWEQAPLYISGCWKDCLARGRRPDQTQWR